MKTKVIRGGFNDISVSREHDDGTTVTASAWGTWFDSATGKNTSEPTIMFTIANKWISNSYVLHILNIDVENDNMNYNIHKGNKETGWEQISEAEIAEVDKLVQQFSAKEFETVAAGSIERAAWITKMQKRNAAPGNTASFQG